MGTLLDRRRGWLDAFGWALSVIGFLSFGGFLWSSISRDGGVAYDFSAYLLAGRNLLEGEPLYRSVGIGDPGAYRYPPIFAFAAAPVATLPELPVTWAYRAACLLCVRVLVGSWRAVGWSLLLVPLQIELVALNATLPIAATARVALRGPRAGVGAILLPATAALKYGTALLVPYLWIRRPNLRRPLIGGLLALVLLSGAHAIIDPGSWGDYVASLSQQAGSVNDAPYVGEQLLFLIPSTLGDFALRLALGVALVIAAVAWRADWLAYTAAAIAVPTLWVARLAALVGVPRLWWEDRPPVDEPAMARRPTGEPGPHRPAAASPMVQDGAPPGGQR